MKLDIFILGETIDLCIPTREYAEKSDWYSWFNDPDINKYLSHITYKRCDSDFQVYQIDNIIEGIVKTIKAFYETLPDEYKNWSYIQRINDLVKNFENKHKTNTSVKKENIVGTTSSDSGVSISGFRKLS